MNSYMSYQMALVRQAQLLRDAEEHRLAELAARPTVLSRITARILRVTGGIIRSRERVVAQSTSSRSSERAVGEPLV